MSGWKEIVAAPRHTVRRMRASIRGSVIKVLNELITNSDDSYYRLEKHGKKTSSLIQIGFRRKRRKKRLTIKEFYIRDYAEGISPDTMQKKFGKYGEDTAGRTRRGYFGQGAKDALCTMKNSLLVSIFNDQVSACRFKIENNKPLYNIEDNKTALRTLQSFDDKTRKGYTLTRGRNGTFVYFETPPNQPSPRVKTLIECLQSFYMLRKILSDPQRRVQLIDHNTGKVIELKYTPPSGEVILLDTFSISHDSMKIATTLTISDADVDLDQRPSDKREGGLLIVDEDDAVLDLTLFGYDEEASAASLFGEIRIEGFKDLFRVDPTAITETRDGLNSHHPFNRLLRDEVRKRLGKIVERLRKEKAEKEIIVGKKLDRQIKRAFARINALMKKEAEMEIEEGIGEVEKFQKKPKLGIGFSPSVVHVESGQIRTVHLLVDPAKIPPKSTISIACDNPKIDVVPVGPVLVPDDIFSKGLLKIPINISGDQPEERGVVTATYREIQAGLFVRITDIVEIMPPSGFDFIPNRARVYEGKRTRLKLMIDTQVIRPAIWVGVSSDNPHIVITGAKVGNKPIEDPRMFPVPRPESGSLVVVMIEIEGRKAEQKGTVRAKVPDKEALAQVRVIEKKPPGGFFNDYKLDLEKDPMQRFSFDKKIGMIYVHVRAPVVQKYLGPEAEYLERERRPQALVMLAEIILQCISRQWAKYRFETGVKEYINFGDPAAMREEVQSEVRQIDYEFGTRIHEWILGEYAEKSV